jgi:lysophospholipase L1-like esterase
VQQFINGAHSPIFTYGKQKQHRTSLAAATQFATLFSMWLVFVLLFLTSCIPSPAGQATAGPLVVQQTPKSRITYVAIGASDAFGLGTDDPATENWTADLAKDLGNGVHLIDLGIPGIHLHNALNVELPIALESHPDLVTIWLGVDDLADKVPIDSYSHDLDLMLSRLQAVAPHAPILVANVPDLTLVPHFQSWDPQTLSTWVELYNNAIATIVKRHSVLLVDLYSQRSKMAAHPEYLSSDGFHPNALGYTKLAEFFYQVLQESGEKP